MGQEIRKHWYKSRICYEYKEMQKYITLQIQTHHNSPSTPAPHDTNTQTRTLTWLSEHVQANTTQPLPEGLNTYSH